MRNYVSRIVPEHTKDILGSVTCDICEKEIRDRSLFVDDVTISRRVGDNFPEADFTKTFDWDICGACFEKHLVPFISHLAGSPRETDNS